jgi:acid phosphatase (class A)
MTKRHEPCARHLPAWLIAVGLAVVQSACQQQGYLPPDAVNIVDILPPAPAKGEAAYEADRAAVEATRRFVGSPRWALAVNDVQLSPADMLRDFSCAVGVALTTENSPRLVHLMEKAVLDTSRGADVAKDHFKRRRPYQIDQGETCQAPLELAFSYDYPSGHTTVGWTWAMLLAKLVPGRATAILVRGRAFGESRIVCGVHNATAVEAGRLTAASILTAAKAAPAFQSDLEAAREELGALIDAKTPPRKGCTEEARIVALPLFRAN